ncbi:hypothetical protein E1176_12285 [Fulvivirga sp. RKSG066]|uniref:DUF6503 family protein n=1 Tax=Fulvivirga aurantia TaxID=2529383 RepID=UPI0012BB9E9C|nr:DUF6503 family protein [Fulvivirga aurantia]MTI21801.1 hypothetical protein [Fulvivirga aurantia]
MKSLYTILLFALLLSACNLETEDPQEIVDAAMKTAGSENINNTEIEFIFRDTEYGAQHTDGKFEYVRIFKNDNSDLVRDEYTNDGFTREINGQAVSVADTMATKYSNSINSVIYFALLPYGLNDDAVNKIYLGEKEIDGKMYHKVEVNFDEEGGGEDFEDVFIYWVNKESKKVDYLAYEYHTEGGGMRFRVAYNERLINEIRFVDYINYKPKEKIELTAIDDAFMNDGLEELSRIKLENIKVNPITD